MTTATALFELGLEELPPTLVRRLGEALRDEFAAGLDTAKLGHGEVQWYATPRRLAVVAANTATRQPDAAVERQGPALKAAYNDAGEPTKAALGFARSCGVELDALETVETKQGERLVHRSTAIGKPATELLGDIATTAVDKLPVPKRMRWGTLDAEFSRPVRWAVLMLGTETVSHELYGVTSANSTLGHRFHAPAAIVLGSADDYASALREQGHVEPDFEARRSAIETLVVEGATSLGGTADMDPALLDEVAALVEWPSVITGDFDARYLELPSEVLIASMKGNQRYFHVTGRDGALLPHFITISNVVSSNPASVRAGNERVIRPRLEDAEFFYAKDLETPLAERRDELGRVLFQDKLGSVLDKSNRVAALAARIAAKAMPAAVDDAGRAGALCKCDLVTEMVGEFPELQGVIGAKYARLGGESDAVATALDEAYMPRFAGDAIPATPPGRAVALADRLDTLAGIFGLGMVPRGDRDPFGLRRAALGVARILIEAELPLDLVDLIDMAADELKTTVDVTAEQREALKTFALERLRGYFIDSADGGIAADTYAAVQALELTTPLDIARRLRAVNAFRALPEATSLAAANKRIGNILRQAESVPGDVNADRLVEPAERTLHDAVEAMRPGVQAAAADGRYADVLKTLSQLHDPVDGFLDGVRVMDDDAAVRDNRVALLGRIHAMFLSTADISVLQGGTKGA